MKTPLVFRFIFLALCLLFQITIGYAQPKDNQELIKLYNAAGGQKWANSWDVQGDISAWYGVTVNGQGRVTEVDLSSNNLVGTLPYMNLPFLEQLNLSDNRLSAVVPPMVTDNLQLFNINGNEFSHADLTESFDSNRNIKVFIYQRQYYGRSRAYRVALKDSVSLSIEYGGQLVEPIYEWQQRDRKNLSDNSVYTILGIQSSDIGRYYLEIRDGGQGPRDLILTSYDQIVYNFTSNDGNPVDSEGAPVRPNELILDFSALSQEQLNLILNFESLGYIAIIDRCNCKNDLILIKILNDTNDVYEQLIDINGKKESSDSDDRDSSVDSGGHNYDIRLYNETPRDIWELEFTQESPGKKAQNIKIAVIDTGYDGHNPPHKSFAGYTVKSKPFKDGCVFGANFVANNNDITDDHGHGNHITSLIIAETPPQLMNILPIKAFNGEGAGTLFDMICAIHYALDRKAKIINISASYWGEKSDLLVQSVERARKEKTLIVASAGNGIDNKGVNIDDTPFYPAALPHNNLITVGCIRPNPFSSILGDNLSGFSNYSPTHVDIVAYGECIKAAGLKNELAVMGGTSQSTALVTRALALELSKGEPNSIGELLQQLPTKSISALNGKIKSAKKICNVKQKLTSWAMILLIAGLIILLIIFIIWRLRASKSP